MTVFGDGTGGGFAGPDTIRINREGRLTPEQVTNLGMRARRSRIQRAVKFAMSVVIAALVFLLVVSYPRVTLAGLLVPVAIAVLGVVVFKPWSDPLGADVRAGRVEVVLGVPAVPKVDLLRRLAWAALAAGSNSSGSGSRDDRLLVVGSLRFVVPESLASAIGGRPVRAYFLPRSLTLLSAEPG